MAAASNAHDCGDTSEGNTTPCCASMDEFKETLLKSMQQLGELDGESDAVQISDVLRIVAESYSQGVHFFLLQMLIREACDRHNASKPDVLGALNTAEMIEELKTLCREIDVSKSNPNGSVDKGMGFQVPDVVQEAFPGAFWRLFAASSKLPSRAALTKVLKRPGDPDYIFSANDVDMFHKTWDLIMGPYYTMQAKQLESGSKSVPQWKLDLMKRKSEKTAKSSVVSILKGSAPEAPGMPSGAPSTATGKAPPAPPPPPPLPPSATSPAATLANPWDVSAPFHVLPVDPSDDRDPQDCDNVRVCFPDRTGNAIHLYSVIRTYTAARPKVKAYGRWTELNPRSLYNILGLLRSLQYDIACYNTAMTMIKEANESTVVAMGTNSASPAASSHAAPTPSDSARIAQTVQYLSKRLLQQLNQFGVHISDASTDHVVADGLDALIAWVETRYAPVLSASRTLLDAGSADFDALPLLFAPGTEVLDKGLATGVTGQRMGLTVRACYLMEGKSLFGKIERTFHVALEGVVSTGDGLAVLEFEHLIPQFTGLLSMSALDFEPMAYMQHATACSVKQELEERGRKFADVAMGAGYMAYTPGAFSSHRGFGQASRNEYSSTGGRVMIDTAAAHARGHTVAKGNGIACPAVNEVIKKLRGAAAANTGGASTHADNGKTSVLTLQGTPGEIPVDLLWRTWPTVTGFSFSEKTWGQVLVGGLRDIAYNAGAFDALVLPADTKDLIRALVVHTEDVAGTDLITGKGEGCIFLLHGPPGVGKTLTAEAIAEVLHRPLYIVSMGELGISPNELEAGLSEIFSLCGPWRALVLIDEAEMLLEQRSVNDIVRNAMVCVMLRLLEYYKGILFLTSNRVGCLDPAFQSRVTCALHYRALDVPGRARVWAGLLGTAQAQNPGFSFGTAQDNADGASNYIDVDQLAAYEMNGRQIKTAVRLALTLARQDKSTLTQRHLLRTIAITSDFAQQVREARTKEANPEAFYESQAPGSSNVASVSTPITTPAPLRQHRIGAGNTTPGTPIVHHQQSPARTGLVRRSSVL
eukprot:m.832411 g.832411  ORF g.832411 m.832411 type:complete len:1042 (-) comp23438_c1_seq10:178-3303(-)